MSWAATEFDTLDLADIRFNERAIGPIEDVSATTAASIGKPATRLAFLLEQRGLRECDLPEVGAQSVVCKVLSGKRSLNLRQTQALARRFCLPMDALA